MFLENNYLSQPHKHSGARTEQDLRNAAMQHWADERYAPQRRLFEAQAEKRKARYEESLREYEMNEQAKAQELEKTAVQPKTESEETVRTRYPAEAQEEQEQEQVGRDARGDEDVEMGNSGGFTSING